MPSTGNGLYPVTVEIDHRYYHREECISEKHKPNCVYLNTLDMPIDFVGRFETLKEDAGVIRDAHHIASAFDVHSHGSKRRKYQYYYEREAQEEVESIYREDILR